MINGAYAIQERARRNLRCWIAVLCLALTVFSGVAHAACLHIPTSSPLQITSVQASDTSNSDEGPVSVNVGSHCAYCCGGTAVETSLPVLNVGSAAFVVANTVVTALPSVATRFDTPPPKSLT